ncbi:MAG: undecaprenyl-diphosphatase UppP [Patescibacteria group bacterium]
MGSIHAFILGVVQGITEFLPISSSGHLLAFHDFLKFDLANSLSFDASLHLGTLLALVVYFWKDVVGLVKDFFRSLRHWDVHNDTGQRNAWTILVGAIPAAAVGFFADSWVEEHVRNLWVVVCTLAFGALVFFMVEAWVRRQQLRPDVTFATAWVVGFAQVIALIPGISRSGATIVAGLYRKLDRAAAARFAFLVSLPVVAGAGLFKATELFQAQPSQAELWQIGIGIAASTVVGYVVIRFLLRYLQGHSLAVFAWYRLAAGGALAIYLVIR